MNALKVWHKTRKDYKFNETYQDLSGMKMYSNEHFIFMISHTPSFIPSQTNHSTKILLTTSSNSTHTQKKVDMDETVMNCNYDGGHITAI